MLRADVVHAIHARPTMAVLAVTGGGILLVSDLLLVPGASRTVLEVVVPYSNASLEELTALSALEGGGAVSGATAARLAQVARQRAVELTGRDGLAGPAVGLGITAALASDRPKKGDHRAHLALCRESTEVAGSAEATETTEVWTITLAKGERSRLEEDRVVADLGLVLLARGCGVDADLDCGLRGGDKLERGPVQLGSGPR